ncbi:hypothetical protein [Nocardia suismassiliense]|uniref:hypothetical protein n=1 Tax=Nocardia suismassiliense TaxID=2077092 RepID=UPI0018FE5B1A|nr:hypothetical protein [Nocardia suismassiliense]
MTPPSSFRQVELTFTESLAVATDIAVRAPSSHNSQPWGLGHVVSDLARRRAAALCGESGAGSEFLLLAADQARELVALPAHHAEMQLSCGLFWRLLQRALAAQGWLVRAVATPADADLGVLGIPPGWRPLRLVRFQRTGASTESLTLLRHLATTRHTDRGPYLDKAIPAAVLDRLADLGADGQRRLHVRYLTSRDDRARFVRFVARHAGRDFAHHRAWRETHSFIRRTAAQASECGDGFTFEHLFGPLSYPQILLRRIALAPFTMRALSRTGFPRILAEQLATVVRRSPAVVTLSLPASAGGDDDLLTAGELVADFWLLATAADLTLHPISIVVQHEDLRDLLQSELMLRGQLLFVARLGYSKHHYPPSPRRDPAASLRAL